MKHLKIYYEYIKENNNELINDIILYLRSSIKTLDGCTSGNISHKMANFRSIRGVIELIEELDIDDSIKSNLIDSIKSIYLDSTRVTSLNYRSEVMEFRTSLNDIIEKLKL